MKTNKTPIYFRYEFSDEAGRPEGGDIFQFTSLRELLEMTAKVIQVAKGDKVAVNFTIGEQEPFFGFLNDAGLTHDDLEAEMVENHSAALDHQKTSTKKANKKANKTHKKSAKKSASSAKPKKAKKR